MCALSPRWPCAIACAAIHWTRQAAAPAWPAPWKTFLADQNWTHATLALQLLRLDPGLGGICIRARSGPVRDRLSAMIDPAAQRLHPAVSDEALFGGLDLSATLASGHLVQEKGLLATPGTLILAMAERATTGLAARLAVALDKNNDHCLIA